MPTEVVYPKGTTQQISWHDVTPRIGLAYDLMGNGKTGIKVNVGKYMETNTLGQSFDLNLSPNRRITTDTTRSWNDKNKNYVPDCDLINLVRTASADLWTIRELRKGSVYSELGSNFVTGWGSRPCSWSVGVSVQQEIEAASR